MDNLVMKKSNTLYSVWGILVFVYEGIRVVLEVGGVLIAIFAGTAAMNYLPFDLGDAYLAGFIIGICIGIIIVAFGVTIGINSGLALRKERMGSKGLLIFYAVIWFIAGFLYLISMIVCFTDSDTALIGILALIICAWDIATGVILVLKYVNLVPAGSVIEVTPPVTIIDKNEPSSFCKTITGVQGAFAGKTYNLWERNTCTIGREVGCDLVIYHSKVSRRHCTVKLQSDGNFQITDHNSKNGTFYMVQGQSYTLHSGAPTTVPTGSYLIVGDADNVLQLG